MDNDKSQTKDTEKKVEDSKSEETKTEETKEQKEEREKQTNKMFTQSELDKMIAREISKVKEQFTDYDELKKKNEEFLTKEKERELASKTEEEKKQIMLDELNQKYEKLQSDYTKQLMVNLRNEVLTLPKYSILPRVYKSNVQLSDDRNKVIESADEILSEFQKDHGVTKDTFGNPINEKGNHKSKTENMAQRVKDAIKSNYMKLGNYKEE